MKARDFCFWLQGYIEIDGANDPSTQGLSSKQVKMIKQHLALVFKHEIDPSMGGVKHQQELDAIHVGGGMDEVAGASTLGDSEVSIPPAIAVKLQELQEEMDKKIEELSKKTGRRPGRHDGMMRC